LDSLRQIVFGILVFFGLVVAIALFLGARSPHSDVISSEIHEIDPNTPSLDISGQSWLSKGGESIFPNTGTVNSAMPNAEAGCLQDCLYCHEAIQAMGRAGRKCGAWADLAEHSRKRLGQLPWNLPGSLSVTRPFADYWLAVADGASPDYDAETGASISTADAEE
jgi:hypothetical protein